MCGNCGCGEESYLIARPDRSGFGKEENFSRFLLRQKEEPFDEYSVQPSNKKKQISIEQDILQDNRRRAESNRQLFKAKNIIALNLVSSPGSGKTSLLESTIRELADELSIFVIEGDQQTHNDADRIDKAGAPVIQINTGQGCHLDANMVSEAVQQLQVKENSVLFIENVGNLVCPSLFDLGEQKRVIIISVTEGDDKPLKYPTMFQTSDLCIINKTDLLPYVDFKLDKVKEYALRINPKLTFIDISVKNGKGFEVWFDWLKKLRNN